MNRPIICGACNVPMVLRHRGSDNLAFWGCPNFPKCKKSVSIPAKNEEPDMDWNERVYGTDPRGNDWNDEFGY